MTDYHTTVLLNEAVDWLNVQEGKVYVDCTLGGGGHTSEILNRGGKVLAIDTDEDAYEHVSRILEGNKGLLRLKKGNFKDIKSILDEEGMSRVDGVLFDLGVSGHQLDDSSRGFSFKEDGPLDMRMNKSLAVRAEDLINGLNERELEIIFLKYGEEVFAKKIAKKIIEYRKKNMISTTKQLSEIVKSALGFWSSDIHPATRVFQALRIVVNDELENLRTALQESLDVLIPQGRLVVISFHSLEDRIVKKSFINFEKNGEGIILTKKPIIPSDNEIMENRRSRSSKLRVFQKS